MSVVLFGSPFFYHHLHVESVCVRGVFHLFSLFSILVNASPISLFFQMQTMVDLLSDFPWEFAGMFGRKQFFDLFTFNFCDTLPYF